MASLRRHEGYVLIDHTNSPGVDPAVVQHSGKDAPIVGSGARFESATITCAHCQAVVILNPHRTRARGYCAKCDHYICDSAICNRECSPIAKLFDTLQNDAERQLGH